MLEISDRKCEDQLRDEIRTIAVYVNTLNMIFCCCCAGDARDAPVPDPGAVLYQPAGVPDRVHGGLHAVHQHCRPLGRGEEELDQVRFKGGFTRDQYKKR